MTGNITRRGPHSWRLKFEAGERDPITGKRRIRTATVRGIKKDAQRELTRMLNERDTGISVEPSTITVATYLRAWLNGPDRRLTPKTRERYIQLAEQQIIPALGDVLMQKLRPSDVERWHALLEQSGGKNGRPLAARTVGHAHRVLHRALAKAMTSELVSRNVASAVSPPKVDAEEIEILAADQINELFAKLSGRLLPIAALALGTGLRRGELCALRWGDVDLNGCSLRVERSMEETKAGLRIKDPKTRHGRRTLALPTFTAEILRAHRVQQLEHRLASGLGRTGSDDLVFTLPDGSPWGPNYLSRVWRLAMVSLELPRIGLHSLRHSHASALIAAKVDIVTISRRLGHGTPAFTLAVYAHLFEKTDAAAARAIDAIIGKP